MSVADPAAHLRVARLARLGKRLGWRVGAWSVALMLAWPAAAADPALQDLQRSLRGQPEAALAALQPLLPTLKGADLRAALVFQGQMCDALPDTACVEAAADRLDALARQGDAVATAMAGLLRALPVVRHGPLGRADRLLGEAADQLPPEADDASRLTLQQVRAEVKKLIGKFDEAVALAQQNVLMSDRLGIGWLRAETRADLAKALWRAQQPEQSLAMTEIALDMARASGDALAESDAQMHRAQLMTDLGREDEDLHSSREAIRLARLAGDKRKAVLGLANLSDHYLRVNDFQTALEVAREALPLAREVHNMDGEEVALENAGFALIEMGHHDEGMDLVRQSREMTERSGALSYLADLQHELGDHLEHVGRLREAWNALREYRRLADESFRHEQQQAVLELEESFDAERRRHALVLLRTENGLKEAQLERHDLQTRIWSVAIGAASLLLLLAVALLRRLRRSNARLASSNARLRRASESDPLTGLANRRHFRLLMQQAADGGANFRGALVLLDLDHFKDVNDQHGHAAGDAVLVEVARRVREALRGQDLAVRWGGEEFLVALPPLPQDQVQALAERLLAVVGGEAARHGQVAVPLTASIGFASFPLPDQNLPVSWERAIDLVDQAMYCAKAQGRNRAIGVVRLSPQAAVAAWHGPEALLSAWRGGQAELSQLQGPVPRSGKA